MKKNIYFFILVNFNFGKIAGDFLCLA